MCRKSLDIKEMSRPLSWEYLIGDQSQSNNIDDFEHISIEMRPTCGLEFGS